MSASLFRLVLGVMGGASRLRPSPSPWCYWQRLSGLLLTQLIRRRYVVFYPVGQRCLATQKYELQSCTAAIWRNDLGFELRVEHGGELIESRLYATASS